MLILVKHSNSFTRPKYTPRRLHKEWVVRNTETKNTVFGPDTRAECEAWRNKYGKGKKKKLSLIHI